MSQNPNRPEAGQNPNDLPLADYPFKLSFDEFCNLAKLKGSPAAFALWLRMHKLAPVLTANFISKLRAKARL